MIRFLCRFALVLNTAIIGIIGTLLLLHSLNFQYGWAPSDFTFAVGYDKLVPVGGFMLVSMIIALYSVIVHD